MSNEKHDPWALLREARVAICLPCVSGGWPCGCETCETKTRIDAALAAYDAEERVEVESDPWWSPSQHRAMEGKCDLHVWRMSLKEWGWSTTVYRDHERGREDLGSGVCNTLDEAKAAAIAAARGMR